jgi:hypothetical protein
MPNPNGPPMAARIKGGNTNLNSGHWDRIKKLGASAGGSTARDLGVGATSLNADSAHQRNAGKIGGKVQGRENARIGWLRHIALIRYGKSHADCAFCINLKVSPLSGTE